jgi:ABC-type multidrug transport system fused ATPase/permease subunit
MISEAEFRAATDSQRKRVLQELAHNSFARPELLLFGAKQWLIQRYREVTVRNARQKQEGLLEWFKAPGEQLNYQLSIENQLVQLLQSGVRALLYIVVAFQPEFFHNMSMSELTFVEMSTGELLTNISLLQQRVSNGIFRDLFSIRNLFECIEMKSGDYGEKESFTEYKSQPNGMKIEVKDLTFSYLKDSPPVLRDVNFTIEPGQIVSIVGYNGSGFPDLLVGYLTNRENNSNPSFDTF